MNPLFSFAITSYKNHHYIFEALDSVIMQDYSRIQLIVSDDGSGDFDKESIIRYIEDNSHGNIESVKIFAHQKNQGTVRNMNFCQKECDGDFIMYLAADDALYDSHILSRYVAEFEHLGRDSMVVCSKVAMCGENLEDIIEFEPSEDGIHFIKDMTPLELFGRMSHTWTIPTAACCYRKEIYDVIGNYDEEYFILDDAQFFIRLARNGVRFYWIDDMIAARHRGGGISHGNNLNLSESYRKYRYDELIFYRKEILPFLKMINKYDRRKMKIKYLYLVADYHHTFGFKNESFFCKLLYNVLFCVMIVILKIDNLWEKLKITADKRIK